MLKKLIAVFFSVCAIALYADDVKPVDPHAIGDNSYLFIGDSSILRSGDCKWVPLIQAAFDTNGIPAKTRGWGPWKMNVEKALQVIKDWTCVAWGCKTVVLCYGFCDSYVRDGHAAIPAEKFAKCLNDMCDYFEENGMKIILVNAPDVEKPRGKIVEMTQAYNAELKKIADKRGCRLVDFYEESRRLLAAKREKYPKISCTCFGYGPELQLPAEVALARVFVKDCGVFTPGQVETAWKAMINMPCTIEFSASTPLTNGRYMEIQKESLEKGIGGVNDAVQQKIKKQLAAKFASGK